MLQILLTMLFHLWVPMAFALFSFAITAMGICVRDEIVRFTRLGLPDSDQHIQAIKLQIQESDYETAVLMLKHCPFSDDIFDLAYELGQKLEYHENWILARYLYSWLVQYDPGMQDFVDRLSRVINPHIDKNVEVMGEAIKEDQFSHYKLISKKISGSTAVVYKAVDNYTQQVVALKVLNQKLDQADDDGVDQNFDEIEKHVLSFLHEAMTISKLDHPNIVKIHDADIVDDQAYIAMDYIDGYPMSERLRRKQFLTAAECLRLLSSMLKALIAAHKEGVVHGDIKPANIMYDKSTKSYILTDFGAANNGGIARGRKKVIVGTPAYMSPEQLKGIRTDGRSDLFSLAATVYHLLTGVQPFAAKKLVDVKDNVINKQVDSTLLTIPGTIWQVLDKALNKKTYQRFVDAEQMLEAVTVCKQQLLDLRGKEK